MTKSDQPPRPVWIPTHRDTGATSGLNFDTRKKCEEHIRTNLLGPIGWRAVKFVAEESK
jgi:hypothetical protein